MTATLSGTARSRRPAWISALILALLAALLFVPRAAFAADNPSAEDYNSAEVVANCAAPRLCVDPTTENLQRALTTAPNEAMFWTGRTVVGGVELNSMDVAAEIAAAEGGTTLEMALERANIRMPDWNAGPAGRPVWTQASQMFAQLARGSVRVVRGQATRSNNIWDTEEFDAVQRNVNVNIVTQVSMLPDGTRPRHAIYTRTNAAPTAWAAPTPRLGVTNPTTTCVRSVETLLTYFHVVATAAPIQTSDPNVISAGALRWAATGNLYSSIRTYYDNGHDAAVANSTLSDAAQLLRYTGEARTAGSSGTIDVAGLETMLDPNNCHPTAIAGLDVWSVGSFTKRSLRVLPLGESITSGTGSSDGAGYRKDLEDELIASGNAVEYVGSQRNGNFGDSANEGHANASISDLDTIEHTASAQYHPNVVLINVGENDIAANRALGDAPAQLKKLVDDALADNSGTTVIVSTIRADGAGTAPIDAFNEAVHQLAIDEQAVGNKVMVADMSRIPSADMANDLHPNDAGYADMADEFYGAMTTAADLIKDVALDPGDGGRRPTGQLRVMVVGDSMSQGREGDWTWRYRLWQWFVDQGVNVQFVGPYTGTREPDAAAPPTPPLLQGEVAASLGGVRAGGAYAAGTLPFDSHHFSVWGRQAAQDKKLIWSQVAIYQPDILLVGLGFNDLGWFVSGPAGTLDSMKTLVDEARAAKPNIDIALANVPQRTHIGGRDDLPVKTAAYNDMLKAAIPSWSTPASPVKLVDWAGSYSCGVDNCPAGYDGLHPNALGEYQIAQAYEHTLHDGWGIGSSVHDVPNNAHFPARPTPVPGNVTAAAAPLGITVTWDKVFGARGYTVRSRVAGYSWTETPVQANRFDTPWTKDGWQWEYQVRTDNATDGQSDWSPIVTAVAHPQTAPPPVGIVTNATATGLDVAWSAPSGPYTDTIDRYQIIIWDKDTPGAYTEGTAVKGLSAHIDGLLPGHRYQVWVVTWNAAGQGWPGEARSVTIGAGTPAAPTGLQVTSTDATTVKLTWNASSGAAGYRIWVRNINDGSASSADKYASTMDTTSGVAYLFPGVWNYEFCVTAINGAAESGKSDCVVAPKPPGS